jgi:predicted S18 family serine protease
MDRLGTIAVVLLLFMCLIPASRSDNPPEEDWVEIKLAGVLDGTDEGMVFSALVRARPGTGTFTINSRPLIGLDMQGSLRIAASVAGWLLGRNPSCYDFDFFLPRGEGVVQALGGPSAGGPITVAMVCALGKLFEPDGWELNQSVMMSGTINLDGSIGLVGDLRQKIEAASKEGTEKFLIPQGQWNKSLSSLGVTIENVSHVVDAIQPFTGKKYEFPTMGQSSYGPMQGLAGQIRERAWNQLKSAQESAFESGEEIVQGNFTKAKDLLESGNESLDKESYYPAYRHYLESLSHSMFVLYYIQYCNASTADVDDVLKNISEAVRGRIEEVNSSISDEIKTMYELQTIGLAQQNIHEAWHAFNSSAPDRPPSHIYNLSYAYELANSAWDFYNVSIPPGKEIALDPICQFSLEDAAQSLIYAGSTATPVYVIGKSIIGYESEINLEPISSILSYADDLLSMSLGALDWSYRGAATLYAMSSLAFTQLYLEVMDQLRREGSIEEITCKPEDNIVIDNNTISITIENFTFSFVSVENLSRATRNMIDSASEIANWTIAMAQREGFEPFLPFSLLELAGEYLKGGEGLDAILDNLKALFYIAHAQAIARSMVYQSDQGLPHPSDSKIEGNKFLFGVGVGVAIGAASAVIFGLIVVASSRPSEEEAETGKEKEIEMEKETGREKEIEEEGGDGEES